ncbi:MAG: helicase C-terminal domain-containing protein [Anaerolineaceae bacterium]
MEIVALDIETTGLNPQTDAVIEIGAVRFNGQRVIGEWNSLINPGKPIPVFISQLTGITNEMIRNEPDFAEIQSGLVNFIGQAPILGHNVRFDLSFLQRRGLFSDNEVLDTYELASVLLPSATRYNLGALKDALRIPNLGWHRALVDAQTTRHIFLRLAENAESLPFDLINEIVKLSETLEWDGGLFFQQVLRAKLKQGIQPAKTKAGLQSLVFNLPTTRLFSSLEPNDTLEKLDIDEVSSTLELGGPFSKYFKQYEHRPQQVEMLRTITDALSESKHLLVEAGTGTGKSFAYLVPSAYWAIKNNTRVLISTNTINLQDQLIKKDIPDLCAALNLDIRAAVLKGRSNYLCPRRLASLRQRGPETVEELRVLAKILVWLQESTSGDRNEINLNGPQEREVWFHLSAEDENCRMDVCMDRLGGACPFFYAKQAAQTAHLLVVNHALLLSDIASGNRILPDYDYLIVDEGHHIESATTSALSFRVTQNDISRILREIGGLNFGVMGRLFSTLHGLARPSDIAAVQNLIQRTTDAIFQTDNHFQQVFRSIGKFMEDQRDNRPLGLYSQQERVQPATRTLPTWGEVEIQWDETDNSLKNLIENLSNISKIIADFEITEPDAVESDISILTSLNRRLSEIESSVNAFVMKPDSNSIYWVELAPNNGKLALEIAPLHIGPLMEKFLWHEKSSVILTSATLTTHGEFDYLRSRLNADEADERMVGSPFDYENSAMLYLVNDVPEPSDTHGYQHAMEQALIRLAKATNGRLLALFTSYAQLKRTSQVIMPELIKHDIQVYEQGDGSSPNTLLENFRDAEKAVLLGTRSFWEGVDIPGEALSVLVITKLPFDVPSDPIVASRSETFDDPFNEYSLPEAILRFRQGFGRLIRTQSDRGVVAVLDKRILTKKYGRLFLESLPTCTTKIGSAAELPQAAAKWLE